MPGGALSISANGTEDGIVWVSMPKSQDATNGVHAGRLVALDATNLEQLWSDDCILYFAKFNPATVADGRVYLATFADPVARAGQPYAPDCTAPDRSDPPLPPKYVPDPNQSVGFAWVLQYGIK